MAEILVIHTGGTIGMVAGPEGLAPGQGLVEAALRDLGAVVRMEVFDPLVDSADIGPRDWNRMLDLVEGFHGDGVIVVHGTDTMALTGAALSQALGDVGFPVVLCGSMKPLGQGGDAEGNLALALEAARGKAGVWLAFAGKVLPGAGLVKSDSQAMDSFRSVAQDGFAPAVRRFDPGRRLAVLTLTPGIPVGFVRAALGELDGAVLRVFGAGTMMNDPALHGALAEAVGRGVRIRAVSQCEKGGLVPAAYAAGAAIWKAGVVNGGVETAEVALMRLWLG
jgi:L-asparaginase